jgi:hypothetical protein
MHKPMVDFFSALCGVSPAQILGHNCMGLFANFPREHRIIQDSGNAFGKCGGIIPFCDPAGLPVTKKSCRSPE